MITLYFLDASFVADPSHLYKFGWFKTLEEAQDSAENMTPSLSYWTSHDEEYTAEAVIKDKPIQWHIFQDTFSSAVIFESMADLVLSEFLTKFYEMIDIYDYILFSDFGTYLSKISVDEVLCCKILSKLMFVQADRFNNYLRHIYEYVLIISPHSKVKNLCLTGLMRFGNAHSINVVSKLKNIPSQTASKAQKTYWFIQEREAWA